jgi:hypothetical protein
MGGSNQSDSHPCQSRYRVSVSILVTAHLQAAVDDREPAARAIIKLAAGRSIIDAEEQHNDVSISCGSEHEKLPPGVARRSVESRR